MSCAEQLGQAQREVLFCEEQTRTCATAQSRAPRNPTFPCLLSTGRGRHVPAPAGGASGLSPCCVLPPSLLSSVVFLCWFLWCCLEAGGAQCPLRPSEGLAGVVVPHLRVAVRFPPTSRGQWHQEHRAPTQEPSIFSGISQQYRCINFLVGYPCSGSSVPCSTKP